MCAIPLFIDTDISLGTPRAEIDDGAALMALLRSDAVDVKGVSAAAGNASTSEALMNAGRLLAALDRPEMPLGRGSDRPLKEDPGLFDDWKAGYGETPLWIFKSQPPEGVSLLIETIMASPEPVAILCLGPLTNLALALEYDPGIVDKVREVVAMGGSFNGAEMPEFNARCDPEAFDLVMKAGWPLRLFGLEITRQVHFSRADFAAMPDSDPAAALIKIQAPGWIDRVEAQGWESGGCSLHDAVAALYFIDESLFTFQTAAVSVELEDPAKRGLTRVIPDSDSQIRVAVGIDANACHQLIHSAMMGG